MIRLHAFGAAATALVAFACAPSEGAFNETSEDAASDDHEEHVEGHIELTSEQFRSAGISVITAGPGTLSETITLPGSVAPNADAVSHVTPRVAGQVRSVFTNLGEHVEIGDFLCVIDSVELGAAAADYLRDREMLRATEETIERARALFDRRLATLETVLQGGIDVYQRIYDREADLQERAVSTVRPMLEAEKALQAAKLSKEKQVTDLAAERDTRMLALEVDRRVRHIDLVAAQDRLRTLGVTAEDVRDFDETSPLLAGEYRVKAAGTGVVVDRHVSPGEFVEAGAKLFIIEDLSNVWFVASAFEDQLRTVRTGQTAYVHLDAFPGVVFVGAVSFVDFRVDPTSRSVGTRVELDNEQLASWPEELPLRPGMFGRVDLETASRKAAVVLPERALVHDDEGDYVFVQVEAFGFERRDVSVRAGAGGVVEVESGLQPGDKVAVTGTFFLKSAERQGELGGGHSH